MTCSLKLERGGCDTPFFDGVTIAIDKEMIIGAADETSRARGGQPRTVERVREVYLIGSRTGVQRRRGFGGVTPNSPKIYVRERQRAPPPEHTPRDPRQGGWRA